MKSLIKFLVLITTAIKQYNPVLEKLEGKQKYYVLQWLHVCGLAASAGICLTAEDSEIGMALWAIVAY